jgi:cytochrome c-type biogenesis protein CcmH/NrfG
VGLVSGLLLLPLAPVRLAGWAAERLADAADKELYDPAPLVARLAALHRDLEEGAIDQDEFEREEEHLLRLIQERQTAASRGAPVATGKGLPGGAR